jgi:hypothetical protein
MPSTVTSFAFAAGPVQHLPNVVYFTEDVAGCDAYYLAAAVVWRISTAPRRWSWREPIRRVRQFFGPFGIHLHLKGRFQPWTGSSGAHGEQETLFNPDRRVVKVLGREYRLPETGQTLVLLIEERPSSPNRHPRIEERTMTLPAMQRVPGEPDGSLEVTMEWATLLQRDPEVATFMAVG